MNPIHLLSIIFIVCFGLILSIGIFSSFSLEEIQKEEQFLISANCTELKNYLKDDLINGTKLLDNKAQRIYDLECRK